MERLLKKCRGHPHGKIVTPILMVKMVDFRGGSKMAKIGIFAKFPLFCTPKMAKIVFFKLKSP